MSRASLIRLIGVLALVASGVAVSRRYTAKEVFRNVAIWSGIVVVLVIGYTFRDTLELLGEKVRSGFVPAYPVVTGAHTMTLEASEDGGFYVVGAVNGERVTFLIDTGASDIVLSPADAARVGIDTASLDYSRMFESANGVGHGAAATIASLSVGPVTFRDVPVAVNRAGMSSSLLGMTFLRRLDSFEIRGHQLLLRWK